MSISEKIKRSMVTITEERYRFQVAEIERLRKALQQIANIDYRGPIPDGVAIARRALGGSDGHS